MQHLGKIQQRNLHYTATAQDLAAFSEKNRMVLVLADTYKNKTHDDVLKMLVDNDPLFVFCCCSNFSDMEDTVADLLCEKYPGFDDDTIMPMTFGETDLASALRFCASDAFHETLPIEHIVMVDLGDPKTDVNVIQALLKGI